MIKEAGVCSFLKKSKFSTNCDIEEENLKPQSMQGDVNETI